MPSLTGQTYLPSGINALDSMYMVTFAIGMFGACGLVNYVVVTGPASARAKMVSYEQAFSRCPI
eukprot:2309425-Pyramimonas_sp.AAC.1